MDEMTVLRESFGPDEVPTDAVRARARTALLMRGEPAVRKPRWALRIGIPVAVAASVAAGVVMVVATQGRPDRATVALPSGIRAALPHANPATAVEYLENAAWSVDGQKWTNPRQDQFMYRETKDLRNDKALESAAPNGPLVPGRSTYVVEQTWHRIDGQVQATITNGKLVVTDVGPYGNSQLLYSALVGLTTPDKVRAWEDNPPQGNGATLSAVLSQYVLPPQVQAAVFRTIAQQPGVRLDPDAVNLDGRPAVGLGTVTEGYLSEELLFDKATYALIGTRDVAVADHKNVGDDGTSYTHKGDVFRLATYITARIVDHPGDTE